MPANSWYALGLLTLVYVFNYLDRTIIYILLPLIKKEMAFSDLQLALPDEHDSAHTLPPTACRVAPTIPAVPVP